MDAVTLHPFLGFEALRRALEFAVRNGGGVFVVVRSSNPEGEELQTARLRDGRTVAEDLCRRITEFNREFDAEPIGPVGAVVGATCHDAADMAAALPHSFLLAPGIGAQGASIEDLGARMAQARGRVLPSVSRAILGKGCGRDELRASIRQLREHARELL